MSLPFRRDALVRVLPFAAFMVLLTLRGLAPADGGWGLDGRWLYALQTGLVAALLIWWWREYGELVVQTWPPLREFGLAVALGLLVFVVWIQLDAPWMTIDLGGSAVFVPVDAAGAIDWPLVVVRWLGATLLVPVMEELFWRSFLMRWIQQPRFASVAPAQVGLRAIMLSTFLFALAHTLWLAAVLAALAYAWIYVYTGRLWTAVIAHAVTNGALGIWVLATGNWHFW